MKQVSKGTTSYGLSLERFKRFWFSVRTIPLEFEYIGDGLHTVWESTLSHAELSEFFGPHGAPA